MNEIREMDEMLTGIKPQSFTNLENDTRSGCPYTWHDIEFNMNNAPYHSDTAIIVTSYHGQLGWLKSTLTSYRKSGHYVILSYDNPAYIWNNIDDQEYMIRMFPRPIHYLLAHSVVVKHKTYEADKRTGWYWDVKYAQNIVNGFKNFKYVYVTNGDCIVERPEGFQELKALLGDGDLMSGQSEAGKTIHTADMLMSIKGFNKIMDYMESRMKYLVFGSQSPETMLRDAVDELGLKEVFAPEQPRNSKGELDYYCTENGESTWKKVLGFRNLYHEFEFHENNGLEPKFKDFMDPWNNYIYFREDWRNTICQYYLTGDRRYLLQFWDRGKDSDYERKYLPLEAYGAEPIWA